MDNYLVEVDNQDRENEAIRRFLRLPFLANNIFEPLGLSSCLSWYLLRMQQAHLVKSFEGEVDVLAGPLTWDNQQRFDDLVARNMRSNPDWHPTLHCELAARELAESGGINWPPSLDYIVAIEAKCAYFDYQENTIKSQKASPEKTRHIHNQIERLLRMGFNRVALVDLIANPPASGVDGQAWLVASDIAMSSRERMSEVLPKRLPADSPAGHFVLSMGAVVGGDELTRGAGHPLQLRKPVENPLLHNESTQKWRSELEDNVLVILDSIPQPRFLPVILENSTN